MRGGELLGGGGGGAGMADQGLTDMRTLPYDPLAGYKYNASIAALRIQQYQPVQPVGSTNIITFDLAPTGSAADYFDLYNSFFAMDWKWTIDAAAVPPTGNHYGSTFGLFFSLLLFSSVRITLNGVEVNDEATELQHFADFHKLVLLQPRSDAKNGQPDGLVPTCTSSGVPHDLTARGIESLPFCSGFSLYDQSTGANHVLQEWMYICAGAGTNVDSSDGSTLQTMYAPYQSLFQCPDFIPCSIRLGISLTLFSQTWTYACCRNTTHTPTAGISDIFRPILTGMTFYARIITLTNGGLEAVSQMNMSGVPMTLPILRATTTRFPIAAGQTYIRQQLTGVRRPQVVILHCVPLIALQVPTDAEGPNTVFPFATTTNSTGTPTCLLKVASLYLRSGSQRFPPLFDKARAATGSGCSGGTIQADYDEYANLTWQYQDGDRLQVQPFLSRCNLEDPQYANMYFFNMAPNGQSFMGRSIIETAALTGTIDINFTLSSATAIPCALIVTTLTNEKITINVPDGRIGRSW